MLTDILSPSGSNGIARKLSAARSCISRVPELEVLDATVRRIEQGEIDDIGALGERSTKPCPITRRQIADSIRAFGFNNPIIVDRHRRVVAGHGRLEAARLLGLTEAPTISVAHLSEAAVRAYALADDRLAEKAGWSRELLAIELKELTVLLPEIELELDITGFEPAEVDTLLVDFGEEKPDPADEIPARTERRRPC